jgi:hypothetical protein
VASYSQNRPPDLAQRIRQELAARVTGLAEKVNVGSLYFGFRKGRGSDALYIYVQKKNLLIDIRLSRAHVGQLKAEGYEVRERRNYQREAGWLTGWRIRQNDGKPLAAVRWMLAALAHDVPVKLAKSPPPIT